MAFKKIKFVTDSTADIPAELVEKWGIGVVPILVNFDGKSHIDNGVGLIREDFYNRIADMNPLPQTSAPSPGMAQEVINKTFADADHLVIITLPEKLSGTYNALRLGAADIPQDSITMIDSGTLTLGSGFQVLIGAEVAAETGDINQVIAAIEKVRKYRRLGAMLLTLEYLRRGGRISFARAGLGALLQIKPIVTVEEGEVIPLARVRTTNRAKDELVKMIREQAPLDRLALLHTNNLEGAHWMREQIADILPAETYIVNVNPALGTHVGPQCLGFVTLNTGWRQ